MNTQNTSGTGGTAGGGGGGGGNAGAPRVIDDYDVFTPEMFQFLQQGHRLLERARISAASEFQLVAEQCSVANAAATNEASASSASSSSSSIQRRLANETGAGFAAVEAVAAESTQEINTIPDDDRYENGFSDITEDFEPLESVPLLPAMSGERVVADNSSAAAAVLSSSSSAPPQSNAGVSEVRAFTSLYYPTSAEGGAMAKIMTQSSGDPPLPNYRGIFSDAEWRYFSAFDLEVEFWASPADPIGLFSSSTSHLAAGGDLGSIVGSSSSSSISNNHSGAQRASTGTKGQKKKKTTGKGSGIAFPRGPSSAPSSSRSTAQNGPFSSLLHFSHHPSQVQQNATAFISSGGLASTTAHIASTTTTTPNQSFTQAQLSAQDSFGTVYSDRPEIEAQNNNNSTNSSSHRISVIKWQGNGHL